MDEYFINEDTLLILPMGETRTKIFELDDNYIIKKNSMEVIDESCQYFGSNYQGRYIGSKNLLKMEYKLPIIIEECKEIVIFPTCSPRQPNCCWVCLQNIENYRKNNKKTLVEFKNGIILELNISYSSFENQVFRATMLLMTLKKRKKIG